MKRIATQTRSAFTLVELLVAMGIIVALAALTAGFINTGAIDSQRLISSADRTSGWLVIAKNRALRDGAPRGVRFFIKGNQVTEAQYIEVPQPWVPNPNQQAAGACIQLHYFDANMDNKIDLSELTEVQAYYAVITPAGTVSTSATDYSEFTQRVNPGDSVYLTDYNRSFRLDPDKTISKTPSAKGIQLEFLSYPNLNAANSPSPKTIGDSTLRIYLFGFQTQARPLLGETPLEIPSGTIIDWRDGPTPTLPSTTSTTINVKQETSPSGQLYFDILFAPSGQVLNNSNGYIALWIRDPSKNDNTSPRLPNDTTGYDAAGEQVLIVVYTRGGYVSTQPVAPSPNKPHDYLSKGLNTGTGF